MIGTEIQKQQGTRLLWICLANERVNKGKREGEKVGKTKTETNAEQKGRVGLAGTGPSEKAGT